ncbi:hypothetical protein [Butyrivibrio sp. NC2007]|uniref:hypothetical protein n=1 Tax=Butyrivibrio sp. NC2007 TaxID=1280683 RepID=UPI0003B3C416|nr:hypothetical protein [Butyrivibrio sp. NC2007]
MFDIGEQSAFLSGNFTIIEMNNKYIELKSNATSQYWLVRKFDTDGYPPVVLYHRHNNKEHYHVHFVYAQDNALLPYTEIVKHDKYILKRDAKRKATTQLSNNMLVSAAFV